MRDQEGLLSLIADVVLVAGVVVVVVVVVVVAAVLLRLLVAGCWLSVVSCW